MEPRPTQSGPARIAPWRKSLVAFALGAIASLGLAALGALAVVTGGLYETTSTQPHNVLVSWAGHTTFVQATRRRARDVVTPVGFSRQQVAAGFRLYDRDRVACHGGPGIARAPWVRGLTPTPPFLLDAARRWTPGELHWIVGRGVKMTAKPAWRETRSDAQIWTLVAFLDALPEMRQQDYARMRAAAVAPTSTPP